MSVLRRMSFAVLIAGCAICSGSAGVAQQPPAATPSITVAMTTGTATISGVVTDSQTHRPIANAVVALGPSARGPVGQPARQLTDSRGRFAFSDLPASDAYILTSSKFGYFDGQYGHTAPALGNRIGLADGQWLNVPIEMDRAASIGGSVVDEFGDPVVGVYVRLTTAVMFGGERQLAIGPITRTDDRGAYRISGLRAGTYFVSVPFVQSSAPASASAASLSGRMPNAPAQVDSDPPATMPMGESLFYAGRYPAPAPRSDGRQAVYVSLFYPGVRSLAAATPVSINVGDEKGGIDFRLEAAPAFRVSGTVQGPPESIEGLTLRLVPAGAEDLGDGAEVATTLVDGTGRFAFVNVPAGSYTLDGRRASAQLLVTSGPTNAIAQSLPRTPTVAGGGFSTTNVTGTLGRSSLYFRSSYSSGSRVYAGRATVTVESANVDGVVLPMQQGVTMTGRIVREGARAGGPPARVWAQPARGRVSLGAPISVPGDAPDSFKLEGLLQGEYYLAPELSGSGLIKSIAWNGEDYTDRPFDASRGRDFTDVTVTVTNEMCIIGGVVRDGRGVMASNAAVLVFPVEREGWTRYGIQSPRIRTTEATTLYRIQGLPAGEYYAVAVDARLADSWRDPAFLGRAAAAATRISLAWGDRKGLDLVLSDVK